jgi:hypothetical protein
VVAAFDKSLLAGMFHYHCPTMIVVRQVLFNPSEPLATAMAPFFSMMATTLAWKQDKQIVISSDGGSC